MGHVKHNSAKSFTQPTSPLRQDRSSKVKYLNFAITKSAIDILTRSLQADRETIDMKHINHNFSLKAWPSPLGGLWGWAEAKNQLFLNSVMLQMKLKGMKRTTSFLQIFCPCTHSQLLGLGQKVKHFFSEGGHVAYQIKEIEALNEMQARSLTLPIT